MASQFSRRRLSIFISRGMITIYISISLAAGAALWLCYTAIEPYVRRQWPQILVSWTRIFSGNWRDTLVARDLLFGCVFGVFCLLIRNFTSDFVPPLFGFKEINSPTVFYLETVLGTRYIISVLLNLILLSIAAGLLATCFMFFLKLLLKSQKAVYFAYILFLCLYAGLQNILNVPIQLFTSALFLFVLMRHGLVAFMLMGFVILFYSAFPITLEASAWYSGTGYTTLAILAVVILYAFHTSLGGRPIFGAPRLDE